MADEKKSSMKTAYERALEKLEEQGIERPRAEGLPESVRREVEEVRKRAEAKLAELEILHRDRLKQLAEPEARQQEEEDYRRERRMIEAERDDKVTKLRRQSEGA